MKLNLPVPSKRASKPNADVSLSRPSRSTKTIVRRMTNEVKNPYIDATTMLVKYESQSGNKMTETPLRQINTFLT